MDYDRLIDLVTDFGYHLAMAGAETFRVEDSINRILSSYGAQSEAFVITNCMTLSMRAPDGKLYNRMRRIGFHGNTSRQKMGADRDCTQQKWTHCVHQIP